MFKITLLVGLALSLPVSAAAQQSAFTTEEAARCGVVFARMADALVDAEGAPDVLVQQVAVGLPVWEYELIATAPNDEARLNQAVSDAVAEMLAGMPDGENDAAARGDFLLRQAQTCGQMIDAAYPDARHPVVTELRQSLANQSVSTAPVPTLKPGVQTPEQAKRKRGLR